MRFTVTDDSRGKYHAYLKERADVIEACIDFLNDGCKNVARCYGAGEAGKLAVIALVRHAVESLDGVSVLVAHGSILPCYPLLRSFFDASISALYIMQKDSDERGLAFFFCQILEARAFFERCDPTTNRGIAIRDE